MMLSTRLLRTAAPRRLVHTTAIRAANAPGRDPQLSQGNAGHSAEENRSEGDVQSQSAKAGKEASDSSNPLDPASGARKATTQNDSKGNKEAVGMQETIGGKSAQGSGGEIGGTEEAQAPGVFSSVKQALGLKTDTGDVKQNQGAGRGVTGTGTARKFHTSARAHAGSTGGVRASPEGASAPKDNVSGDQNAHLHHKSNSSKPDNGKGNAAEEPTLPSQRVPMTSSNAPSNPPKSRGMHTSAILRAINPQLNKGGSPSPEEAVGGEKPGHTAASYDKDTDVDDHAPKDTTQPRAVDGSSSALDAPTDKPGSSGNRATNSDRKPGSSTRGLHTSAVSRSGHSADSYFKEVDDQTPRDSSQPHTVDSSSSALDKPGETASGPFHQAGTDSPDYQSTSKASP